MSVCTCLTVEQIGVGVPVSEAVKIAAEWQRDCKVHRSFRNTILVGDVREQLRLIPDETVNCIVTSPPYWGLRDYGQEDQLGLEATPDEYVAHMVDVFRECRRVLRKDGTLWLNLGDSYAGSGKGPSNSLSQAVWDSQPQRNGAQARAGAPTDWLSVPIGLKAKDLVGIPWRVAFALQADGWWLRSDIIWSKPNPMPESVTDRPTKSHEYIFLLSKSQTYWYDADAIRENYAESSIARISQPNFENQTGGPKDYGPDSNRSARKALENLKQNAIGLRRYVGFNERWDTAESDGVIPSGGRNKRTVWEVATQPYPEAHFATYPEDLVKPCILAGCPEGGIVLDPFLGSGTTALVAKTAGRDWLGIELNPAYVELAKRRINVEQERLL